MNITKKCPPRLKKCPKKSAPMNITKKITIAFFKRFRDSDAHFMLQGASKLIAATRSILLIPIKFHENVFY